MPEMKTMLDVEEAEALIRDALPAYPEHLLPLTEAHGQILRQAIRADRDIPPYDRVTMDGIAIAHASYRTGHRSFVIENTGYAGAPAIAIDDPKHGCVQIMTGALLPNGADTIVPFEEIEIQDGVATIRDGAHVAPRQFLHSQGSDKQKGTVLLEPGIVLRSPHLAISAAVGIDRIVVAHRPSIALISTGDEIVPVNTTDIQQHQIRSANHAALYGALARDGYRNIQMYHAPDDAAATRLLLESLLKEHAVLILTGGVSMGTRDVVPSALESLQVRPVFHKIKQKPGKPMWFGMGPLHQAVFALPGNPVSALVCLHRYVLPSLTLALGARPEPNRNVYLKEPLEFKSALTGFLPVSVFPEQDGRLSATARLTNTSGDYSSLAGSDGFVELPQSVHHFLAGFECCYYPWI